MDTIEEDFSRFSQLHSWYKHVSPMGEIRCLVLRRGEQPRNSIHPDVKDVEGLHWAFYTKEYCEKKGLPTDYVIRINSFTRGLEWRRHPTLCDNPRTHGFWITKDKWPEELRAYLDYRYPEIVEEIYKDDIDHKRRGLYLSTIYENEYQEQLAEAKRQAQMYLDNISS